MTITSGPTIDFTGQIDTFPRRGKMVTTDNLTTIKTAGYLNQTSVVGGFKNTDILDVIYSYNKSTGSGIYNVMTVSISNGMVTLSQAADTGSVILPVVSGNIPNFSGTSGQIADSDISSNVVLTSSFVKPDTNANLVYFNVTAGQAALASGGSVTLYTSSASKQYVPLMLFMNSGGTNFSGGSGNRLLSITDGTTVYSVIPATNLQTLVNAGYGISTPLPFPASAPISTPTAAGASLVAKYSGGSADYTAGSVTITGLMVRIV